MKSENEDISTIDKAKAQIYEIISDRESFIYDGCEDFYRKDKQALEFILIYVENIERELKSRTDELTKLKDQYYKLSKNYDIIANK